MKGIIVCFLLLVCNTLTIAQKLKVNVSYSISDPSSKTSTIFYVPGISLNWEDFKGKPLSGSDAAAITSAGFTLKLSFSQIKNVSELILLVYCSFSKNDSWVKPTNKTNYILNHEQKHFDIAYIHSLLFIKRLRTAAYTIANYQAVIEKIYKETARDMATMQNEYDQQTDHSRIADKQQAWNTEISKTIESLKISQSDFQPANSE